MFINLVCCPFLPPGISHAITSMKIWHQAIRLQDLIIGLSALASLLTLWLLRPKRHSDKTH